MCGAALRVPSDGTAGVAVKQPERPWVYLGESRPVGKRESARLPQVSARAEAQARAEASRALEAEMAELGVVVPVGCHVRVDPEHPTGSILTNFVGSGKPRPDPASCAICRVHPDDSNDVVCRCCALCMSRRCVCGPEGVAMRSKERAREERWAEEDRQAQRKEAEGNPAGADEFLRAHYAKLAADAERDAAQWAYVENVLKELKHRRYMSGLPLREVQRLGFVSTSATRTALSDGKMTLVVHGRQPDLTRAFSRKTVAALSKNHGVDPANFSAASPTKEELLLGAVN